MLFLETIYSYFIDEIRRNRLISLIEVKNLENGRAQGKTT